MPCYTKKTTFIDKNQLNFVKKNLEMIKKNTFVTMLIKKNNKTFGQKKF